MESLPDEVLLMVLGGITDAFTLLDAVPLVCRRWHRLSRHPEAWASASVKVQMDDEYHRVKRDDARLLLHAPALRELEVSEDCNRSGSQEFKVVQE